MSDLIAFLSARLDEDEAAARAASPGPWRLNAEGDEVLAVDGETAAEAFALSSHQQRATAAHIARHDPARLLREVEAKRAIVALHKPDRSPDDQWYGHDVRCEECGGITGDVSRGGLRGFNRSWPCKTVRALTAVYADHPDYQQEWKP